MLPDLNQVFSLLNFPEWSIRLAEDHAVASPARLRRTGYRKVNKIFESFDYIPEYDKEAECYRLLTRFAGVAYHATFWIEKGMVDVEFRASAGQEQGNRRLSSALTDQAITPDLPAFSTYEELTEVLRACCDFYERFKVATYNAGRPQSPSSPPA